jgi:hypothetical protein
MKEKYQRDVDVDIISSYKYNPRIIYDTISGQNIVYTPDQAMYDCDGIRMNIFGEYQYAIYNYYK